VPQVQILEKKFENISKASHDKIQNRVLYNKEASIFEDNLAATIVLF